MLFRLISRVQIREIVNSFLIAIVLVGNPGSASIGSPLQKILLRDAGSSGVQAFGRISTLLSRQAGTLISQQAVHGRSSKEEIRVEVRVLRTGRSDPPDPFVGSRGCVLGAYPTPIIDWCIGASDRRLLPELLELPRSPQEIIDCSATQYAAVSRDSPVSSFLSILYQLLLLRSTLVSTELQWYAARSIIKIVVLRVLQCRSFGYSNSGVDTSLSVVASVYLKRCRVQCRRVLEMLLQAATVLVQGPLMLTCS